MKGNKKGFYKSIGSKRKTRENVGLLLNVACDPVTEGTQESKVAFQTQWLSDSVILFYLSFQGVVFYLTGTLQEMMKAVRCLNTAVTI